VKLRALFAPEHGLHGALQDQITAQDYFDHSRKITVYSLYSKSLADEEKIKKQIDCLVIDLQDIGSRYYTFLWSAMLLIEQMERLEKKIYILDRPNPLTGKKVAGPVLEKDHISFVGLYPIPIQHGMTIAELCTMIAYEMWCTAEIEVIPMKGWSRAWSFSETGLQWTIPSPNMPSYETALVYPGMCLLEGTNVSEGRGTTRPFEVFGAPWIDADLLTQVLQKKTIPGARFRPAYFIPTFSKYAGKLCRGAQLYVTGRKVFDPVTAALEIIATIRYLYLKKFKWRKPPYEFEKKRMPFDILIGNSWVRNAIEDNDSISTIKQRWQDGLRNFRHRRKKHLLYD
jgi:uncharacterized protein YbbC (DUF1343 family)